jgi:hypothetical protein
MDEEFGRKITLFGPVKFIGDPEDDPENNVGFQIWKKALQEVYQPERLSERTRKGCDSLNSAVTSRDRSEEVDPPGDRS